MFAWARRLLERIDPDVWAEDRATAMLKLPPVANIPIPSHKPYVRRFDETNPPVDLDPPKFSYGGMFSKKEYAALQRRVERAVADFNKTPPFPNTVHRPPRKRTDTMDIDRHGKAARKPKRRKRKAAKKSKKRKAA